MNGRSIAIRYQSGLADTEGNPAHAASFIRRRLILLDEELRGNKTEHDRILLHEVFHFVWVRLGNRRRLAWEALVLHEWKRQARGEAGWSAEWRKGALRDRDVTSRTRPWREYCCESFCDTAAWVYRESDRAAAVAQIEITLAEGRLRTRRAWFSQEFATGCIAI